MTNGKLYRFETVFQNEPQDVGFFQVLYDIGLPEGMPERLENLFVGLPMAIRLIDVPAKFWFTAAGIIRFHDAIKAVASALRRCGWGLVMAVTDEAQVAGAVAYRDEYQVAVRTAAFDPPPDAYRPVTGRDVAVLAKTLGKFPEERTVFHGI